MNPVTRVLIFVIGLILLCLTGFMLIDLNHRNFPCIILLDCVYLGYLFFIGYRKLILWWRTWNLYNRFPMGKKQLTLEETANLIGLAPDFLGSMRVELKKSFITPYAENESWVECRRFSGITEDIYRQIVRQVLSFKHTEVVAKLTYINERMRAISIVVVFLLLTGNSVLFLYGQFPGLASRSNEAARDRLKSGDLRGAEQMLFWSLIFHRDDSEARDMMADICSRVGNEKDSKEYLEAILSDDPGYFSRSSLNKKLAKLEINAFWHDVWFRVRYARDDSAIAVPESGLRAVSLDSNNLDYRYDLIFVDILNGFRLRVSRPELLEAAMKKLRLFIAQNSGYLPPLVELGLYEWKIMNRPRIAIGLFRKAATDPEHQRAKYYLIKVAEVLGDAGVIGKYYSPQDEEAEKGFQWLEDIMGI